VLEAQLRYSLRPPRIKATDGHACTQINKGGYAAPSVCIRGSKRLLLRGVVALANVDDAHGGGNGRRYGEALLLH
jgi:hypothetical protein